MKEHIFIGIPTLGWTTSSLAGCLPQIEAASHHEKSRFRFSYETLAGARPADYARNWIVREFLKTDATRLMFLDADIIPSPDVLKLLNVNADIVAGLIPIWQDAGPSLTAYRFDPSVRKYVNFAHEDDRVEEADAASTAVMVIRREVLEDPRMRRPAIYTDFDGSVQTLPHHEPPPVFLEVRKPNGQLAATEDIDFCYRAKKLGYSLAIHHGVVSGHVKEGNLLAVMDWAAGRFEELLADPPSVKGPVAIPA